MIDGSLRLHARRARSINDFAGRFEATLSKAKAPQIPVLSDLTQLSSVAFSGAEGDGTIQGRIGGGLIHIDPFLLSASNTQVLVTGTTTIGGRLDMEVTATTGQEGPADQLLSLMDSPLMLAVPAPVALIAKANDALRDRVIHVDVGGTASSPVIRLNPGKHLDKKRFSFFWNRPTCLV
ncbi:hypothetical protein Poly41_18390 [Novipirellula artificiosorum]|uniref:AsmA-like C-terminal domain-containing protein n=1 Tax=Novipirellula artificiosorum TaxID=2528016 RepID=A0A5C6DXP1_9BACT|nr:hypothetical protein Poly41_18390 [Novipirellula artificiosorum]